MLSEVSSMYKIKTQVDFEAAHRLYNIDTYSTECRDNIHGHSYKVTVVVSRKSLNSAGMVIDFKKFKQLLNDIIVSTYDHSCILQKSDPLVSSMKETCHKVIVVDSSPTAEWMAESYFRDIQERLHEEDPLLVLQSVQVQETEHNIAIYEN